MRVAIVGAGAMGSVWAVKLALAGHDLNLVEINEARRTRINSHGIKFRIAGKAGGVPVPCYRAPDLPGGQDVLILFTKFDALLGAFSATLHALKPEGMVLVLSNGLGVANEIKGLVPAERLVLGVTDVAADLRESGVHSDGSGITKIGSASRSSDPHGLDMVEALLASGQFEVHRQADVRGAIWEKVAFNAAFNALATIVNVPVNGLDNDLGRRLITSVLTEVAAVALAKGVPFKPEAVRNRIEAAFQQQGHHLPSMVQDRRAGLKTEIAAINGAIADRGERLGLAVPVNRMLADLVMLTGG